MRLQALSKIETENAALKVAAILRERIKPAFGCDPFNPHTWLAAADNICALRVWQGETEDGSCYASLGVDDSPARVLLIEAVGSNRRPAYLARVLIHELSHAVLWHYAPCVFTEDTRAQYDYCYQARENICRAVERYFLGEFGRGWLPAHGNCWN